MFSFFKSKINLVLLGMAMTLVVAISWYIKTLNGKVKSLEKELVLKNTEIIFLEHQNIVQENLLEIERSVTAELIKDKKESQESFKEIRSNVEKKLTKEDELSDQEKSLILIDSIWKSFEELK